MKSGQRFAEGDPTVPMVTLSAARAGAMAVNETTAKPSAARPSLLNTFIAILLAYSMRFMSETRSYGAL
jgi:hypothetical protein